MNTRNIQYIIFPLFNKAPPYVITIPDPDKHELQDEIAIPVDMLKQFIFTAASEKRAFDFETLRRKHRVAADKISHKDLGHPLGNAAFAEKELITSDNLIYSGMYFDMDAIKNYHLEEGKYLLKIHDTNFFVDSKHVENKSRLIQHLQDEHDDFKFPTSQMPEHQTLAEANLVSKFDVFIKYKFKKITYNIPIVIIKPNRIIKPGEILGLSYGSGYWYKLGMVPSFFTRKGKLINAIYAASWDTESNNTTAFIFKPSDTENIITTRFLLLPNFIALLPNYVKKLTADNTNATFFPYLYIIDYINAPKTATFNNKRYLLIPVKDPTSANKLFNFRDIVYGLIQDEASNKIAISLSGMAHLSLEKAQELFSIMNDINCGKFKFRVSLNKAMYDKLLAGKNINDLFFESIDTKPSDSDTSEFSKIADDSQSLKASFTPEGNSDEQQPLKVTTNIKPLFLSSIGNNSLFVNKTPVTVANSPVSEESKQCSPKRFV